MADVKKDIREGDPRPLEWFFACYKIGWGTWLLLPLHTFATSPHLFRYVAVLPEWVYGSVWVTLGLLQIYAYVHQIQILRYRLACIGGVLWSAYGALLWYGDHRSSALVQFGVFAIFKALTAIWLKPRRQD